MQAKNKYKLINITMIIILYLFVIYIFRFAGISLSYPTLIGALIGTIIGTLMSRIREYKKINKYIGLIGFVVLYIILIIVNRGNLEMVQKIVIICPVSIVILLIANAIQEKAYRNFIKDEENKSI